MYIHDGKRDFTRQIVILRPQVVHVVRHCAAFDRLSANQFISFVMMAVINGRANPCRARSECAPYKAQRVRSTYPSVRSLRGVQHAGYSVQTNRQTDSTFRSVVETA